MMSAQRGKARDRMKQKQSKHEKGQILVLIALVFTVLLGFGALAVDGGMAYSNRRYAQNVADASSLAGGAAAAHWMASKSVSYKTFTAANVDVTTSVSKAMSAAVLRANSNNLSLTSQASEAALESSKNGVFAKAVINPATQEKYIEVRVIVTTTTQTAFAHLFFPGILQSTVESVTRVVPNTSPWYNNALVSLSSSCAMNTGGMYFNGKVNVAVDEGNIFSNSCMDFNGASGNVKVSGGGTYLVYPNSSPANPVPADPKPVGNQPPIPTRPLSEILGRTLSCGNGAPKSVDVKNKDNITIDPGNYSSIQMNKGDLKMNPGLYCMSGDFSVTGGNLIATGVTIYHTSGQVKITGNASVTMSAPGDPAPGGAVPGMLIVFSDSNSNGLAIEGTSASHFKGTIYGLHADLDIGGNSGLDDCNCQLIGEFVKVHGNPLIKINFNASDPFTTPTRLNLIR